ncbi:MAG: hypothetical protein PWQ31_259 [Eubacteriales bacterium]|nr:hypothetical protein [Eubacteriales bacterium]
MRVAVARADDYSREKIMAAVQEVVDVFGGMERFVRSGEKVLVKPNMLEGVAPEKAVTTHPEVVRAVLVLVKEAGGIPVVGDSPGVGSTLKAAEKTGIAAVCREEGVEVLPFTAARDYLFPEGRTIKKFTLARELGEVDKVISVAKMKTHTLMGITGAVKNLFGLNIGPTKAQFHLRMQRQDSFAAMLCDLARLVKPAFSLVDGVVGMEGNGPRNGKPKKAGVILGGDNPFAVDLVMARMMGFEAERLPVNRTAREWGLVPALEEIEVVGDGSGLSFAFEPPRTVESLDGRVPAFLLRLFQNQFTARPVMNERCIACGRCAEHCPPKAISIQERKAVVDYRRCIRCYCCQELCPADAVVLQDGFLLRLLKKAGR